MVVSPGTQVGFDGRRRRHGTLWSIRNTIQRHVRGSSARLARHQVCWLSPRLHCNTIRRMCLTLSWTISFYIHLFLVLTRFSFYFCRQSICCWNQSSGACKLNASMLSDTSLILTLGSGVYITAMVKVSFFLLILTHQDYFCIERPLSPPVRRLVIGSYHLEYGFPSTHSANAVGMSIALYYFLIQIRKTISYLIDFKLMEPHGWGVSLTSQPLSEFLIVFYTCTVIYGRLYLGMHSAIGASTYTDL